MNEKEIKKLEREACGFVENLSEKEEEDFYSFSRGKGCNWIFFDDVKFHRGKPEIELFLKGEQVALLWRKKYE